MKDDQARDDPALRALLERVADGARSVAAEGRVADYIPALAAVPPERFAIAIVTAEGREAAVGDADLPFSIQSISKLFTLALAMEWLGPSLWERVGREPSGMRFNSLIQLETERGIPRNPFINAGALAVMDALVERRWNFETSFRTQMRRLSGNDALQYDSIVHRSERAHGDLNRAIAYVLKAHGNLRSDPESVCDSYFRACAMAMSVRDLARATRFLMGAETAGLDAEGRALAGHAQRLRAIMRTCGLYDQSGEFAFRVGLPGKSGVGGGIVVAQPGAFTAAVWSPPLDRFGNSVAGQAALELLAKELC
ncbi:MAG: glutaminase [Pseudomonadota bacterium]